MVLWVMPLTKKVGNLFFGFQHFNYGKFAAFDELGNNIGSFSAADYALILAHRVIC
jgi:hypothetical protein